MRPARLFLSVACLLLAGCAGATPPPVWASLNCSSISDPKDSGMTYSACVQQWMRTNDGGPPGGAAPRG